MGDKKRLIILVFLVVGIAAAAYTWYPIVLGKKTPPRRPPQVYEVPTLIEVPAQKAPQAAKEKAPTTPAPTAPREAKKEAVAKAPTEAPAEKAAERFGLDFPPFVIVAEADECERRLKEDGLTTFRAIRHLDHGLYTAVVGPFPSAAKASQVMAEIKAKPGQATTEQRSPGEFFVEDGPYNLREVVHRASEIRRKGHGVRVAVVDGRAPIYRIRTAMKLDQAQASKLSSQYREAGCPNRIVAGR
ncbi:MAG: SPOR domain-containing protein [Candidatus Rokubacteria bacterium]|nr:SPOR domain-containing protein [Candidatus Rokubacteria bacterium]